MTHKRILPVLAALGLVIGSAPDVSAQSEVMSTREPDAGAVFQGQVVDSVSGDPIEGVLIRMDTGETGFSDRLGEFLITGIPQGRRMFAMLTADCRITWNEITVVNGIPRNERYRLPPAFGAVAAEEEQIVEERKRTGGRVLEQAEIDRISASSVLELVRRVAPNMVSPMQGAPGDESNLVSARGRSTGAASDAPVVVIDGVRMPGAEGTLYTMRPHEISRHRGRPCG